MSKKFLRFVGESMDPRFVFEVAANGITTFAVTRTGFFKPQPRYEPTYTLPITKETIMDLRLFKSGSGMCEVRTGQDRVDYHVYANVKEFAQEIQDRINRTL